MLQLRRNCSTYLTTMIKKLLIGLVIIIGVLCVVISLRPGEFNVTRTTIIPAPQAAVFPYINDLHKWQEWSPWAKLDPNVKNTFEGPSAGAGAKFGWSGNNEVGEGYMVITESKPDELVRFHLEFVKPMTGKCDTLFVFKPEGSGTHVTWNMTGKNEFIGKAISLVMDCDKMMGDQFEQGFANLKEVVAKAKPAAPAFPAEPAPLPGPAPK